MKHVHGQLMGWALIAGLASGNAFAEAGITAADQAATASRKNEPTSPPPNMSRETPASIAVTPAAEAPASSVVLLPAPKKRILVPRTGSGTPSGISGVSNQSGGRPNGINDGSDASRGANGGAGTIAPPLGSKPLQPRDKETSPAVGRH